MVSSKSRKWRRGEGEISKKWFITRIFCPLIIRVRLKKKKRTKENGVKYCEKKNRREVNYTSLLVVFLWTRRLWYKLGGKMGVKKWSDFGINFPEKKNHSRTRTCSNILISGFPIFCIEIRHHYGGKGGNFSALQDGNLCFYSRTRYLNFWGVKINLINFLKPDMWCCITHKMGFSFDLMGKI